MLTCKPLMPDAERDRKRDGETDRQRDETQGPHSLGSIITSRLTLEQSSPDDSVIHNVFQVFRSEFHRLPNFLMLDCCRNPKLTPGRNSIFRACARPGAWHGPPTLHDPHPSSLDPKSWQSLPICHVSTSPSELLGITQSQTVQ